MEYKFFQNNLEDAQKIAKYMLIACISEIFIIFMLIILCIVISHRQMTVLVPMNLNSPMSVRNNAVSSQYLDENAISFINLRLNFDPDTIDENHKIILKFLSSDNYKSIRKALDQEAFLVKSQGISSSFYISNVEINKKTLSALISGTLVRSVSDKALKPAKVQFLISFENNDGLLTISKFVEEKADDSKKNI